MMTPLHVTAGVRESFPRNRASYYLSGTSLFLAPTSGGHGGCTIFAVKKRAPAFRRRKLSAVVRKAIISYYNEQEKQEIARAAKKRGASVSSFVASAALTEARRTNRRP